MPLCSHLCRRSCVSVRGVIPGLVGPMPHAHIHTHMHTCMAFKSYTKYRTHIMHISTHTCVYSYTQDVQAPCQDCGTPFVCPVLHSQSTTHAQLLHTQVYTSASKKPGLSCLMPRSWHTCTSCIHAHAHQHTHGHQHAHTHVCIHACRTFKPHAKIVAHHANVKDPQFGVEYIKGG